MRVTTPRWRDDERGAAAVIVAIAIFVLFGLTAYAVDAGGLWRERRHVIRATDAAVLAAAQEYALGGNGCGSIDDQYTSANDSQANVRSCEPDVGPQRGTVTLTAYTPVDFAFAGVLGVDDRTVSATATAEYNSPTSASGLRPYGLCSQVPQLAWIGSQNMPTGEVTFEFEHKAGGGCGVAAGNWGALEMADGECFSAREFGDCVDDGAQLPVSIGDWIGGAPGADLCNSKHVRDGLEHLIATGAEIGLPVYDEVTGNGANAEYHISAFVGVVITDFERSGSDCSITLRFTRLVTQGTWAPGESGPLTGLYSVRICDVDAANGECGA